MAWFSRISALEPFHWWLIVLIPIVPPKAQPFLIAYKINSKLRSSLADKASYDLTFIFAWFFFLIFFFTTTEINWSVFWEAPFLRCLDLNLVHILFQPPDLQPLICLPDKAHSSLPGLKSFSSKKVSVLSTKGSCISTLLQTPTVLFLDCRCVYIYIFYTST